MCKSSLSPLSQDIKISHFFRLDHKAYPGSNGEDRLHCHFAPNMKKHVPIPDWINDLYEKYIK